MARALERRLDATEPVPWLLDTIFTLAGRVRPYHKDLPWELRGHPLPDWEPEALCAAFDDARPEPVLVQVIEGWGDELALFRG